MISSLFASLHYLTLALGLGGVFMRGRYLRAVIENIKDDKAISNLFIADSCWGVAALLWIFTGLMRAFGGLEKGSNFYLQSPLFWLKMGLFITVAVLEVYPMMTFLRLRMARKKGTPPPPLKRLQTSLLINNLQLIIIVAIPFVASAMARGLGL